MKRVIAGFCFALASASAMCQFVSQPWTPKLPSWESRVKACATPTNVSFIALDEFKWPTTAAMTKVNWWGSVSATAQLNRRYHIAFYKPDPAACRPLLTAVVYQACVIPQAELVGVDCMGKNVYKFFSNLPTAFSPVPGQQYWIQISEDDSASIVPGKPDFWWSSHQPIVNCPALQISVTGGILQPLVDTCSGNKNDLAFELG